MQRKNPSNKIPNKPRTSRNPSIAISAQVIEQDTSAAEFLFNVLFKAFRTRLRTTPRTRARTRHANNPRTRSKKFATFSEIVFERNIWRLEQPFEQAPNKNCRTRPRTRPSHKTSHKTGRTSAHKDRTRIFFSELQYIWPCLFCLVG